MIDTTAQNSFVFDLLDRVAAIQRTIQVTGPDNVVHRVKFALPRWWEPIGNNGFPGFYNRATRIGSTPAGRPMRKDVYNVTMRLAIGPAFAGYRGEYEDLGNMLYVATINRFDRELKLGDPAVTEPRGPDNGALRYVEAARVLDSDAGIEGKDYGGTPQMIYMCLDIPLNVTANFQNFRNS